MTGWPPHPHSARDPSAATARRWLAEAAERGLAVRVRVLSARGSVPREAGTAMLVSAQQVAGTIGGGHLELQAIDRARRLLAHGGWPDGSHAGSPAGSPGLSHGDSPDGLPGSSPHDSSGSPALDWPVALGPSLGQCCGGALTLRFEPLSPALLATWPEPPGRFRLHLFGAGHVGRAIAQVLALLPCQLRWVDARPSEFPAGPLPESVQALVPDGDDPADTVAEVAQAAPGDFFLVLTHSHALDLQLVEAILQRGDAGYCGLIGSASKKARFLARLRQKGFSEATLAQLSSPIGLPDLGGGKTPGEIAVAVAADLLRRSSHPPKSGQQKF